MPENIPIGESVAADPLVRRFRRVVSGVDQQGRSRVVTDGPAEDVFGVAGIPGYAATNFWRTDSVPADNSGDPDDGLTQRGGIAPPPAGVVFRAVQFAPDSAWADRPELAAELYHGTPSLDFAVVIEGEIVATLDTEERVLRAGDVMVQRGTAHGWLNRTDKPAIVAFVLVGGNEIGSGA